MADQQPREKTLGALLEELFPSTDTPPGVGGQDPDDESGPPTSHYECCNVGNAASSPSTLASPDADEGTTKINETRADQASIDLEAGTTDSDDPDALTNNPAAMPVADMIVDTTTQATVEVPEKSTSIDSTGPRRSSPLSDGQTTIGDGTSNSPISGVESDYTHLPSSIRFVAEHPGDYYNRSQSPQSVTTETVHKDSLLHAPTDKISTSTMPPRSPKRPAPAELEDTHVDLPRRKVSRRKTGKGWTADLAGGKDKET